MIETVATTVLSPQLSLGTLTQQTSDDDVQPLTV
jgi:hypothetical protein